MTKRNPWAVIGLSIITLGIYYLIWLVKTKGEMVERGAEIPTSWLIIIPIANIYWLWKFAQGVGHVTNNKTDPIMAFLLLFLVELVGGAIVQYELNNKAEPSPVQAEQSS